MHLSIYDSTIVVNYPSISGGVPLVGGLTHWNSVNGVCEELFYEGSV